MFMQNFRVLFGVTIWAITLASTHIFAQAQIAPRFEPAVCAIEVPANEKHVECGYLTVSENRQKRNGRTIRLPVVILKTNSATPKPDPVLKTLGGPGDSSLKMIRGRASSPWLKDRDYIIFEQRGTLFAQPALECPEVDEAVSSSAKAMVGRAAAKTNEITAAAKCYKRLRQSGIDLDAYNSAESAADIADLRKVLKIEKINLYGVSYSSRLMLDVLRYHPEGVRSVVLESTLTPEANYDEEGVDWTVRSLNQLFTSCRAEKECSNAYPDLEKEFYSVVDRLNKQPITAKRTDQKTNAQVDIRLDGFDFVTWVIDNLFSNEPAATVYAPFVIHQAFNGTYVEQFRRDGGPSMNGSFYTWGMRYSVWCSEEIPFESMKKIRAQSTKYPGLNGYEVMALPDICSVWKVSHAAPIENKAVMSDIPALVFTAEYDAYTPPAWGEETAGHLKNSFLVEIPWAGHGPGFSVPCVRQMAADFINDPGKPPDPSCVTNVKRSFKFTIPPT